MKNDSPKTEDRPTSLAACLELLASLSDRARQDLAHSPHCVYHDSDSVFMDGTPAAQKEMERLKLRLNYLYGKFGVSQAKIQP
jgi:hypothetical protein